MKQIPIGISHTATQQVTEELLASKAGSGTLSVYATPYMIAFMELCSLWCAMPYLDEGETTVGTSVNIEHLAPTPLGGTVRTEAKLIDVQGRKLIFEVTAFYGETLIGKGFHGRHVINIAKFMGGI
jgi:predicted thioesterase